MEFSRADLPLDSGGSSKTPLQSLSVKGMIPRVSQTHKFITTITHITSLAMTIAVLGHKNQARKLWVQMSGF